MPNPQGKQVRGQNDPQPKTAEKLAAEYGERKMGGEMLVATPRARGADKGGRPKKLDGSRLLPSNPPPTLASLGISKRESAEAQTEAGKENPGIA